MAPLIRRESENSEVHPFSLWVGNVGNSVTESDLLAVFSRFGALDCFISYSSRSFAFVYFRRGEDARAAREALQGMVVLGTPMKIEFARPVCSDLQLFAICYVIHWFWLHAYYFDVVWCICLIGVVIGSLSLFRRGWRFSCWGGIKDFEFAVNASLESCLKFIEQLTFFVLGIWSLGWVWKIEMSEKKNYRWWERGVASGSSFRNCQCVNLSSSKKYFSV